TAAVAAAATAAARATATAVAAATRTAAAVAAAAAVATRPLFARTRLVDADRAAVEGLPVHAVDCRLRFGIRAHLDEAEALGAASVAVHHDLRRRHGAVLRERLLQVVVAYVVREIAD